MPDIEGRNAPHDLEEKMTATITTQLDRVHHELRELRHIAYTASTRHDARAFGHAVHLIEALERIEDALLDDLDPRDVCECGADECPGAYKPDGSHELAF